MCGGGEIERRREGGRILQPLNLEEFVWASFDEASTSKLCLVRSIIKYLAIFVIIILTVKPDLF